MLLLRSREQTHDPLAGTKFRRHQIYGLVCIATRLDADRIAPGMIENGAANCDVMDDHVGAGDVPDVAERQ